MSLRRSYTLLAPVYDLAVDRATRQIRRASLDSLPRQPGRILLAGIGTGLDLPHLPQRHQSQ